MEFEIIRLPKGKSGVIGKIVQDDLVSRQTIVVQDMVSLGLEGEDTLILIEGAPEALQRAVEIIEGEGETIKGDRKQDIYGLIKKAEDDVAEGLGLMFG